MVGECLPLASGEARSYGREMLRSAEEVRQPIDQPALVESNVTIGAARSTGAARATGTEAIEFERLVHHVQHGDVVGVELSCQIVGLRTHRRSIARAIHSGLLKSDSWSLTLPAQELEELVDLIVIDDDGMVGDAPDDEGLDSALEQRL